MWQNTQNRKWIFNEITFICADQCEINRLGLSKLLQSTNNIYETSSVI